MASNMKWTVFAADDTEGWVVLSVFPTKAEAEKFIQDAIKDPEFPYDVETLERRRTPVSV